MKLQEKLQNDLKVAMTDRNEEKKSLLRVIIGEMNRMGKELTDELVIKILKKMLENAKELNNEVEIRILSEYVPKDLTPDELLNTITKIIVENKIETIKEMGKIMQELKKLGVPYDGKLASDIIKAVFTEKK